MVSNCTAWFAEAAEETVGWGVGGGLNAFEEAKVGGDFGFGCFHICGGSDGDWFVERSVVERDA